MRGSVVFCAMMIGACTASDRADTPILGSTAEAIVDGTSSPSSQDSAVLISDTGNPVCTGVLIAPNLVLTARHCVTDYNDRVPCGGPLGEDRPANVLTVSVGATATSGSYVARGARLFTPTGATQLCGADIALMMLDDDVKNVAPAALRFTGPSVNEVGTAIGYGDDGDAREQRTGVRILALGPSDSDYRTQDGQQIVMDLSAAEVASTESTCYGDSGGPLLDANAQVMAIASRGPDNGCKDRPTFWTSIGGHADLINAAAIAAGHPLGDPATSTTPNGPTVAGTPEGTAGDSADGGATSTHSGAAESPGPAVGCNATRDRSGGGGSFAALLLGLTLIRRRRATR